MPNIIYCDESGQRDYGPKTDKFFVVAGVVIDDADATHLEYEIRGLKRAILGTPDIEIKSNWIRLPQEREKRYTQPYGIGSAELSSFMQSLVKWIRKAPITFVVGVVDKPGMLKKYTSPHYAGAVSYTLLMQRFQTYVSSKSTSGNVVFDDPAGKSPGGHEWRKLLLKQHASLKQKGCPYTKKQLADIGTLTFSDSAASSFIQLADLLSYNTFRQFRDHGTAYDDPDAKKMPLYQPFCDMLPKFHQDSNRTFADHGLAFWPCKAFNKWRVPKDA